MKRLTTLLIIVALALCWHIVSGQDQGAPQPAFQGSPVAQQAAARFVTQKQLANQRYEGALNEARRQYIAALKNDLADQTKKHNADMVQRLTAFIQQLEAQSEEYKKTAKTTAGHKQMSIDLGNGPTMNFVRIPAGEFLMGSPNTQAQRGRDEDQHQVTLTRSFYMSATVVTQAQYMALVGANPSRFKGEDLPVENVSWVLGVEFCKKLSEKSGKPCRIPTEAEWEYAAHAGTQGAYSFGDNAGALADNAWYAANSGGHTHPVGTKPPNAWGLYDMHGNVWQLCFDWYAPYTSDAATDPTGPAQGGWRMTKGGAWDTPNPADLRISMRLYRNNPTHYNANIGIRVVMEIQ